MSNQVDVVFPYPSSRIVVDVEAVFRRRKHEVVEEGRRQSKLVPVRSVDRRRRESLLWQQRLQRYRSRLSVFSSVVVAPAGALHVVVGHPCRGVVVVQTDIVLVCRSSVRPLFFLGPSCTLGSQSECP